MLPPNLLRIMFAYNGKSALLCRSGQTMLEWSELYDGVADLQISRTLLKSRMLFTLRCLLLNISLALILGVHILLLPKYRHSVTSDLYPY